MAKESILPTHEPAPSSSGTRHSGRRPFWIILAGCIFALAFFKGESLLSTINGTAAICVHGNHQQRNAQPDLALVQKIDETIETLFIKSAATEKIDKRESANPLRRDEASAEEDTIITTSGRSGYNRRDEDDLDRDDPVVDTYGRSGYNRREDGTSGHNKVNDSGRSGYNRREETDGRSGYNKIGTDGHSGSNRIGTDGRSGYNRREETNGRSGYNGIGTDGRSGYSRSF